MLKTCHENNLEFHAWFNPLRAISHDRFSSVAKNHITSEKPEWFMHYGDSYYYNPGIPEVRSYLVDVILEVVNNYDIDGVHLDDYFYPYTISDQKIPDEATFRAYSRGFTDIADWRRDNINLFIEALSKAIKEKKKHVKFGISPLAIWRNKKQDPSGSATNSGQTSYDNLYCDTKLWVEKGWLDYIAPQLYWSTDNLYANYNTLLSWWDSNCATRTHLYIGHALYKLDQNQKHRFDTAELIQQVKSSRVNSKSQGSIYFRAKAFHENHQNFQTAFTESIYQRPALLPTMPWIDSIPPLAPDEVNLARTSKGNEVQWVIKKSFEKQELPYQYAIYRFDETEKEMNLDGKHLIGISRNCTYLDENAEPNKKYIYCITSLDRLHNESLKYVRTQSIFR